jgi:arabinogalactan endo-1,4-beta-galactosidase
MKKHTPRQTHKLKSGLMWLGLLALLATFSTNAQAFIMGFDASYVTRCENKGVVWKNSDGTATDIFPILKSYGVDCIRLRVWVNPPEGYCNKADVLALALRAKKAGITQFYLTFHLSDSWADPARQTKPAAWDNTLSNLNTAVYDHTRDVVGAMIAQGTPPTYVSIGNEIDSGMLWNVGNVCKGSPWSNLAQLINSGRSGVKSTGSTAKIVLHISWGSTNDATGRWWFDNIKVQGVQYDVIAISYYPYWHGSLSTLFKNIVDLRTRYGKEVIVAEFAYPWTLDWGDYTDNMIGSSELTPGYPATPAGQSAFFQDVVTTAKKAGATGVLYWGGEWVAGSNTRDKGGSPWENQALFDLSWKALPAMNVFTKH